MPYRNSNRSNAVAVRRRRPNYRRRRFNAKRQFNTGDMKYGTFSRMSILRLRSPQVIPDQYVCKMNLSQFKRLAPQAAGDVAFLTYEANKIFQVTTENTRQPMGYQELANLYDSYLVYAVKARTKFANESDMTGMECIASWNAEFPGTPANVDTLRERPYNRHVWLNVVNSGTSVKEIITYIEVAKLLGLRRLYTSNEAYAGQAQGPGTTPIINIYYSVYATNLVSGQNGSVNSETKFTFYVKWFNRRPLLQSSPPP